MEVKYVDISAQYRNNTKVKNAIMSVLEDGQFILGPQVQQFETSFAQYCGVRYAVGVSSGTDALFLALKLLDLEKSDEVIVPSNTFLATVGAVVQAGAYPRIVDVEDDCNISVGEIKRAVNNRTKAVIPVHLTGNPAKMGEILEIAEQYNLFIVEDACQAIGARIGDKKVGGFGDLAAFSLHPLKNLNTCGDGGVITTNSETYYLKLLRMRNHGLKNRNESVEFAYNSRLDTIKAAITKQQLPEIETVNNSRIKNAELYDRAFYGLNIHVHIPPRRKNVRQVFHTYVVQVEHREELMAFLLEKEIETKIHYPIPVHLMECAKRWGYGRGDCPVSEQQALKIVSLPVHQFLREEQIYYVIDCIREFYGT